MRRIVAPLTALLSACVATAPADAATADSVASLPEVRVAVRCVDDNNYGTMWADFKYNTSTGHRSPYRGGWSGQYKWDVTQIEVLGIAGSASNTYGTHDFNPAVRAGSQYVPPGMWATRSTTAVVIYLTMYENGRKTHCSANLPSN